MMSTLSVFTVKNKRWFYMWTVEGAGGTESNIQLNRLIVGVEVRCFCCLIGTSCDI